MVTPDNESVVVTLDLGTPELKAAHDMVLKAKREKRTVTIDLK
jgi:hypothetical protein